MDRLFSPSPSRTISYPPLSISLGSSGGEKSGSHLFPVSLPVPLVTPPFDLT